MIFLFIYHVETYLQLNICHVEKLLHMTICHMENFLHMTNFFSTHTGCDGCDKYQVWSIGPLVYWFIGQYLPDVAYILSKAMLK